MTYFGPVFRISVAGDTRTFLLLLDSWGYWWLFLNVNNRTIKHTKNKILFLQAKASQSLTKCQSVIRRSYLPQSNWRLRRQSVHTQQSVAMTMHNTSKASTQSSIKEVPCNPIWRAHCSESGEEAARFQTPTLASPIDPVTVRELISLIIFNSSKSRIYAKIYARQKLKWIRDLTPVRLSVLIPLPENQRSAYIHVAMIHSFINTRNTILYMKFLPIYKWDLISPRRTQSTL
jgi:hypothetical protein